MSTTEPPTAVSVEYSPPVEQITDSLGPWASTANRTVFAGAVHMAVEWGLTPDQAHAVFANAGIAAIRDGVADGGSVRPESW